MVKEFFDKSVCIKPWSADLGKKRNAVKTIAAIPDTSFLIGDVSTLSGEDISFPAEDVAEYIAAVIELQKWSGISFDALADNLKNMYEDASLSTVKAMKEAEITLIQGQKFKIS